MIKNNPQHNFGAGPGILPQIVIEKAAAGVLNFNDSGLSILEISHRSTEFVEVIETARSLVKELLNVPDGYTVLFLNGGASLQFTMVPQCFLQNKAAYIETGVWAQKALKEAKLFGQVDVIASSADKNFSYIPTNITLPVDADYLHLCSNNTIYGTQFKSFPASSIPVVCDMSSDIFSREIDVSKFDLIYAGAQKNMGPAGTTCVIIKDEMLGKIKAGIPTIMNYKVHVENESMFNTPACFAIYVVMLTMQWLKELGGVKAIQEINQDKAALLYAEIDRNSLFTGNVAVDDRSLMNVCFTAKTPELGKAFLNFAEEKGIVGIKGHRLSGGFRASLYNALPLSSVQFLVLLMQDFEKSNA